MKSSAYSKRDKPADDKQEADRFKDLTKRLLSVPKKEIAEKAKRRRPKPSR